MILLGASGENSSQSFAQQQQFIIALLDKMEVSRETTLVGSAIYGYPPQVNWKIGDIATKNGTKRAVLGMKNPGINSDIYRALSFINNTILQANFGARQNVPKTVLMFSEDNPVGDKAAMGELAKSFKDRKVKLVVIKLGKKESQPLLEAFAYDKYSFFAAPSLDELHTNLIPVTKAVLTGLLFSYVRE